ncbi:MAG: hypothetical protein MSC31_16925 [Solirubrobacteraceae bacterium MAG38_C4-C5]|nr:hypothetical protein [Candidatus Siliceabacter maunaloa]
MPEIFHDLCAGDERMLLESAADDLADVAFLDRAGDELFLVAQEAKTTAPPAGAPAGWGASSNGVLAAAAMALRTGRAIGLLVRSGYGVEAAGLVRRLGEITQRAASCAQDPTGTYARNWGEGAGRAGKPSTAYMQGVTEPEAVRVKWSFLSQMEHANLRPYLNFMCSRDERGEIVHPVAPARHAAADALVLSSAALDLARTAAAVCKAHPHLDDGPTLELAEELRSRQAASDARIDAWVLARQQQMQPDAQAPDDGGADPTDSVSR